ncbi:MAG: OB-fold domain-containing protein [bacterium]|nr:OB-fold domain-containing protein [bacterium]
MTRPIPSLSPHLAQLSPDPHTRPFWDAARQHRLVCQRCTRCGMDRHPPLPICPWCQSPDFTWRSFGEEGTIFTYTIAHHPFADYMRAVVPYALAVVEFDDAPGVRMVLLVVDSDLEDVQIGRSVQIAWDDIDAATTVPRASIIPRKG